MDSVDNVYNRVGGLEWIGGVVRFGRWQLVLRVYICRDRSSISVARDTTERETTWLDGDYFVGVSLKQTCRQQQANFDVGNVIRRNFEESQVPKLIVNRPSDFALAVDL